MVSSASHLFRAVGIRHTNPAWRQQILAMGEPFRSNAADRCVYGETKSRPARATRAIAKAAGWRLQRDARHQVVACTGDRCRQGAIVMPTHPIVLAAAPRSGRVLLDNRG
jgi:hypothetical protein